MKGTLTVKAAVALCLAPSLASAGLVYSDGAAHYINTATPESVLLENGSELRIGNGAVLTGDGTNPGYHWSRAAIGVMPTTPSNIYIGGNAVVNRGSESNAIARLGQGSLHVGDEAVVNGNIYAWGFGVHDILRTHLSGNAQVNGNFQSDGLLTISGNARISGYVHEENGGIDLRMDGGSIGGNLYTNSLVDHSALITAGTIGGGIFGNASSYDFSLRGGTIEGRYGVNSTHQNVQVYGGTILGGMEFGSAFDPFQRNSSVSIFSGSIDVAAGDYLFDFNPGFDHEGFTGVFNCASTTSTFSIWGGQLGHTSSGNGLHLDYCATLDIYGTNLSYSGGMLTGLLADGSALNLSVTEEARWGGALRLHDVAVPEPGTLGLFATALGALGLLRRRKATRV
jgi:PEP-CTERM motif